MLTVHMNYPKARTRFLSFSLPCKPVCPALDDLKEVGSAKASGAGAVTGHPYPRSNAPQGTLGHEEPLSTDVLSCRCCLHISRNQPKEAETNRKLCFILGRKKIYKTLTLYHAYAKSKTFSF